MPWYSHLVVRRGEGETFLLRRRPVPAIDFSYGDPRLAAVRDAARADGSGQWPTIRAQLAAAVDGEDLTFLVEGLAGVSGVERWVGEAVAARPGDPLALLVSGARQVERAWQARGRFEARHVSEEQAQLFHARLETAEEQLSEVAEREPSWAAPWYFLQICGRGLEVGQEVAERRFEATVRRFPGHLAAHRQHVQQLSGKWGGSHERMASFARDAMRGAPAGSPLGELVALAHLEQWLAAGGDAESPYLRQPDVLRDLYEAAARSVRHPAFVRRLDWPVGFNTFAMAFALAGDHAVARPLFRTLGKRGTEMPWRYLDERSPLAAYLAWRARSLH